MERQESDYGVAFYPLGFRGNGTSVPLLSCYQSFPDSYRKEISFVTNISGKNYTTWTDPRPHMGKFTVNGNMGVDNNFPVYRFAEVLLMFAEAENEASGPTPAAYEALNQIRRRAYKLPLNTVSGKDLTVGLTQAEFRAAVREERRQELAFELKRWYDLYRWGVMEETMKPLQPRVQDYHYLYPIPQTEINLNKALTQNPGYD